MTGNVISLDASIQMKRDREVFAKRLSGMSMKNIAHEYGCAVEDIHESVVRMLGAVTPSMRVEMIALELDRIDELHASWWDKAKTDEAACALVLKMMERRARLLGIDKSPTDDTSFNEQIRNREKSTAAWERGIALLCGNTVMIEGTAQHVEQTVDRRRSEPDDAE